MYEIFGSICRFTDYSTTRNPSLILLVFERGPLSSIDTNVDFIEFAIEYGLAILVVGGLASSKDLQFPTDPTKGVTYEILRMLSKITRDGSSQILDSPIIVLGHSAAAIIGVRLIDEFPGRIMGVIAYNPCSHSLNLSEHPLTNAAIHTSILFIISEFDKTDCTISPLQYFSKASRHMVPWTIFFKRGASHNDSCEDILAYIICWCRGVIHSNTAEDLILTKNRQYILQNSYWIDERVDNNSGSSSNTKMLKCWIPSSSVEARTRSSLKELLNVSSLASVFSTENKF